MSFSYNEPSLAGFVVYILLIFIPGLSIGEVLDLWGTKDLSSRIAYSIGISIALETNVFLLKTSGISIAGFELSSVSVYFVYAVLVASLAALLASISFRKKFKFPVKPKKTDFLLFLNLFLISSMLYLYFQKYPIFPEYLSPDFAGHVSYAEGLISGSIVSIPGGILYYGVHYQLAAALLLAGGNPLINVRTTMAILVAISPFFFYLISLKLTKSRYGAILTSFLYTLFGAIWFDTVFNAGLYANFFGIIIALFLTSFFVELYDSISNKRLWAVFIVVLLSSYFSHYTIVTLLPVFLIAFFVRLAQERKMSSIRYAVPAVVSVSPGALIALIDPRLISTLLYLGYEGGGLVKGTTELASLIQVPVLSYAAIEVFNDVAFVTMIAFALFALYKGIASRSMLHIILAFWVVALIIASPWNISAWRFSLEALVPLFILACCGIYEAVPKSDVLRKKRGAFKYVKLFVPLLFFVSLIVVNSWGQTMISDALTETSVSANAQYYVYQALIWMQNNTPSNARYLSVSDWRFTYSSLLFGRDTDYAFTSNLQAAVNYSISNGYKYIIVTNVVTEALPPEPSLFPWNNFHNTTDLAQVYSNQDVRIFEVS